MLWMIKIVLIVSLYESDITKITICYLNKFVKIVVFSIDNDKLFIWKKRAHNELKYFFLREFLTYDIRS